jgi:hypothetical protein
MDTESRLLLPWKLEVIPGLLTALIYSDKNPANKMMPA